MSMACEYAQLFTAKQPPTKSQAVKKKEKKTKKKQKKAMESPHQCGTHLNCLKCFSPIDWLILKTGTDSLNSFAELLTQPVHDLPEMILIDKFCCLSYKEIE